MYKILVVDDEKLEREGIRELLAWMELNIEVVGEASNGKKALEMAQQIKPDIVVTDIRMPGISGIELAAHLKKQFPDIKIIFVTGYQDFEYAKRAISLGVCGYVLKPIDKEELFTVIKKAVDEFEYEQHNKEEKQMLTRQIEESLPLLQQQFLRSLLLGSSNLNDELLTRLREFRISFEANTYRVAVVSLDNYRIYEKKFSTEQKLRLTQSILYRFNDMVGSNLCSVVVQMEDNLFACLIPQAEGYTQQTMEAVLVKMIERIELDYGITATVGISQNASSCRQLHQLYQEALAATRHKNGIWAPER
ncbi:response regulator [Caldicoprobacter algeriensis]|uniref:response regulator n=1 Tax=Caldicoprobacter algeriensis TaxID=699281 RepID=UPI00207AC4B1|nr:response regulator [Caldicoprobacter algeriensis]MCM8901460.1 response regulator [Caldicoprobacter algeriensis]